MKKNIVLTLVITVLSFILLGSAVIADTGLINFLSKVKVVSEENSEYTLNLIFKHQYKGNAFIQKQNPGSYIVFIPDTFLAKKKFQERNFKKI